MNIEEAITKARAHQEEEKAIRRALQDFIWHHETQFETVTDLKISSIAFRSEKELLQWVEELIHRSEQDTGLDTTHTNRDEP